MTTVWVTYWLPVGFNNEMTFHERAGAFYLVSGVEQCSKIFRYFLLISAHDVMFSLFYNVQFYL